MQQAVRRKSRAQALDQVTGELALRGAHGCGVPLGPVGIFHCDERRLAADRDAHVVKPKLLLDTSAERVDRVPLLVAVRLRHARRFDDAAHAHRVVELRFAFLDCAADRRGAHRLRGARERNVALAREQTGGRVEADPAGTGQVDFGPRVQVGEVAVRSRRAVERLHVGHELDQITGYEPRSEPQMAQQVHEQPAAVAARPRAERQRLFGRLNAGLHADRVLDFVLQPLIQLDEEVDAAGLGLAAQLDEPFPDERPRGLHAQERLEVLLELTLVRERNLLGVRLQEEIERIAHGHVGDEIYLDAEMIHLLREDDACEEVAEGVLLPVQEVAGRLDLQRVAHDRRAAVRRGPQAYDLRSHLDRPVVLVAGEVIQGDVQSHAGVCTCVWVCV